MKKSQARADIEYLYLTYSRALGVLRSGFTNLQMGYYSPYNYDDIIYSDNPNKRRNNNNTGNDQKRRRRNNGLNNNKDINKLEDKEYKILSFKIKPSANLTFILRVIPALINIAIAVPPAIYWDYEAYFVTSLFSTITYIFNTGCINYIIGNSRIFTYRELLPESIHINGFLGGKSITYIKLINLLHKKDYGTINFKIYNIYFLFNNTYNFISLK